MSWLLIFLATMLQACLAGDVRADADLISKRWGVFLRAPGTEGWAPAAGLPQLLLPNTGLRTTGWGRAEARHSDGTRVEVQAATEVRWLSLDPLDIQLVSGSLAVALGKHNLYDLTVRTPAATCQVQWGSLRISVAKDLSTTVGVLEGFALVHSMDGQWFTLAPGQKMRVENDGLLATPSLIAEDRPQPEVALPAEPGPRAFDGRSSPERATQAADSSGITPAQPKAARPTAKPSPDTLLSALSAVDRDPDASALNSLHAVIDDMEGDLRRDAAASLPLDRGERQFILHRAYSFMLPLIDNQAVRTLFSEGHRAFAQGRYLEAADRFGLCRLLAGQPWVRDAAQEYLSDLIPRAAEIKAGRLNRCAHPYLEALAFLTRRSWPAASQAIQGCASASTVSELDADELQWIAERLRSRLAVREIPEEGGEWQSRILREGQGNPRYAADSLEAVLYRFSDQTDRPWWQKSAERLQWAYFRLDLQRLLAEAQRSYEANKMTDAFQRLVDVLQRSPGEPQAIALLQKLQEKSTAAAPAGGSSASIAPAAVPATPRLPIRQASPKRMRLALPAAPKRTYSLPPAVPAPAAAPKPSEPDLLERAQKLAQDHALAEQCYRLGTRLFLDEPAQAVVEYMEAVRLNPDLEDAKKTLHYALAFVKEEEYKGRPARCQKERTF